jgi:hypothetical protein
MRKLKTVLLYCSYDNQLQSTTKNFIASIVLQWVLQLSQDDKESRGVDHKHSKKVIVPLSAQL